MIYKFVRGDTFAFKVPVKLKNDAVLKEENVDTIYITARKDTREDSKVIFEKTKQDVQIDEEGYCHAVFNPEDTENLDYGFYIFDVEITLKSGYRQTKVYKFELTKEATIHGSGDVNGNRN